MSPDNFNIQSENCRNRDKIDNTYPHFHNRPLSLSLYRHLKKSGGIKPRVIACVLPQYIQSSDCIDQTSTQLSFGTSSMSGLNINARGSILNTYNCISNTENVLVFKWVHFLCLQCRLWKKHIPYFFSSHSKCSEFMKRASK
jgi:hypothetical protein